MIKVIELFAGVGAQRQALKQAGIEHEVVAISEIDKYAEKAYELLHGETKNQVPQIQNGSPVYLKRTVRTSKPNESNLITEINKYCVYESFDRLGWLFMPTMPEKPTILFEKRMFLAILNDKMSHTYNDAEKKLFKAMIAMTQFIDDSTIDKQFYFGTEHFETVWEKLIDITFGIKNKEDYFPRTNWKGRIGEMRAVPKHALEPDSIMVIGGQVLRPRRKVLPLRMYGQYRPSAGIDQHQ